MSRELSSSGYIKKKQQSKKCYLSKYSCNNLCRAYNLITTTIIWVIWASIYDWAVSKWARDSHRTYWQYFEWTKVPVWISERLKDEHRVNLFKMHFSTWFQHYQSFIANGISSTVKFWWKNRHAPFSEAASVLPLLPAWLLLVTPCF